MWKVVGCLAKGIGKVIEVAGVGSVAGIEINRAVKEKKERERLEREGEREIRKRETRKGETRG
jgi:hypothetical protein